MANRYWVGGTGTWTTTTTNWSASSGGPGGATAPTAADSVFFDQAATYTVTMTGALACLDITVSAGTVTFATGTTPTLAVSGSMSLVAGTVWSSTGTITFNSATTGRTITTNGTTLNAPVTFNSTGSWLLGSTLTVASARTTTLTQGTLNLNGFDLSTGFFTTAASGARSVAFGTNNIVLTAASGTALSMPAIGGFTWTGTGGFTADASVIRTYTVGTTTGNSTPPNLTFTGSGTAIPVLTTGSYFGKLDFGTTAFTLAVTSLNVYTALILSTTGTFTNLSIAWAGTGTITTNGKPIAALDIANTTGTVTLAGALSCTVYTHVSGTINFANFNLTCSSTAEFRAGTLSNIGTISCTSFTVSTGGTLTLTSGTITPSTSFVVTGNGTFNYNGGTLSPVPTFTHTLGTVTFNKAYALTPTGTYVLGTGALNLNGFDLTTGIFNSSGSTVRSVAFGANNIILAHTTAAQVVLSMNVATNFTWTGTGGFVTDASITRSYNFGSSTAYKPNLTFTGTGSATQTFVASSYYNKIDFGSTTCSVGTELRANSLILSPGGTYTNLTPIMTGTGFITSNGKAIAGLNIQGDTTFTDQPTFATATAILTLGSGNLNLSGFDLTVGEFRGTGSSTRSITFGANNIILAHTTAGTTVLAAAAATNFTWTGTGGFVTDASITRSYNFGSTDGSIAAAPNLTFTGIGTATQTFSTNSWFSNLDFGTTAFTVPTASVYVNTLTLSSGGTFTGLQPILTRTQTWTAQFSKQLAGLGFNLAGGTLTLDGTQTYIANSTFRLAQGTLDLGGYDLTVGIFSSNATETRSIAFGSNKIILNHTTAGTTVLSMGTASNFSYTGTGQFITDASITRTFTFGTGSGATSTNSPSLSFTGSGTAIQTLSTGSAFNNLDFGTTSFALPGAALSVSSLTLSSTGTYSNLVLTMFGTGTITPNGKSISSFIVNCPGGTTTLAGALTTGVTAITTLTAGTLNLAGFTLTTGTFSSNNSNARGIGFGTGNIVLSHTTAATTVLAVSTATNFTTSGTGGFVSDASITRTYQFGSTAGGSATNAPNLSLTGSGTAVQTFIGDSWFDILNFGTTAFTVPTATVNVDTLTLSSGGTFTGLTPQFTRTQTWTAQFSKQLGGIGVNTPGVTLTFDSTQTYFAQIILTAGTLNLGGNDLTTALLSSSNSNPRAIAFGSNNIILSSGIQGQTLLSMANATSFTWTGTGGFVTTSLGTKTLTFGTTGGTSTNAPNLTFTDSGTSVTTLTSGSWFNKLDFGTVSFTLPATTLNLNSIILSTNTNGGSTAFLTAIMVGTGTITPNGKSLGALTINHTGITTLAGALFFGESASVKTEVTTLTSGTLDLAGFNLTTATFSSSNTNTRSIAFGSGFINLVNSSSNQVVLSMADATNFTWTGTGGFVADGTVTRICRFGNTAGGTSTNAPNLAVTRGINDLVVTLTTGSWFNTLQFFGTIYTVPTTALNVNNLILSTNGTFTGLSINAVGTGTITTNGKTIAGFTVNNDSGTTTLADALSCASYTQTSGTINFATLNLTCSGTATYTAGTLTNIGTISCSTWVCAGTFTMTHGTITPGISFVVQGGFNYNSGTLSPVGTFTQTSGTVTLGQAYALASTSTYTLTAGTLNLNGYDLTTGVFASSNSNVRSVVFGANNIILVYALNSAIVLSMTNANNFTYTGTGGFVSTMSFSRSFRFGDTSGGSVDNAPNLTLITGASSITLFSDSWFNKLDFGSTTFTLATTTLNLESLTLSTSGTYTSLTVNAVGTGTITPNGKTIAALTINHSGTTTLAGALTTAATAITTLTAGTLDLAGYTMTTGALSSSNTNTRSIAFGTGSIALTHTTAGTTVLSMADATGFTYTGTPTITTTAAVTRTFSFGSTAGGSASNAPSLSLTSGAAVPTITTNSWFKALNFTGTTSTPATAIVNVDTLTLATGGTYTGLTPIFTRTQIWTPQFSKQLNGIGFNVNGGTLTLGGAQTYTGTSVCYLLQGTLDLGGTDLTIGIFNSNNTNTRAVAFGSNNIILAHTTSNTTVINAPDITNFTCTGTGGFSSAMSVSKVFNFGSTAGSAANAANLSLTSGASTPIITTNSWFKTLDFTGTTSTPSTTTVNVDTLTLASGGTYTGLTPQFTRTQTWTAQFSKTLAGIGVNKEGEVLTLDNTQTYAPVTGNLYVQAGTLNLNSTNQTFSNLISTRTAARSITGPGSLTIKYDWIVDNGTGFTGSDYTIYMASQLAKTFAGGGGSYGTLVQHTPTTLNITGSNTFANMQVTSDMIVASQQEYTTPGTYSWTAPPGVYSVSAVCIGGGANGSSTGGTSPTGSAGGGGGLGWKNNIAVTPGATYTVVVGANNSSSYFINTSTVAGYGAGQGGPNSLGSTSRFGGGYVGDGGGRGGTAGVIVDISGAGGGGAGGYSGAGGNVETAGAGGGGGGGGVGGNNARGGFGGGTGIFGQGNNGASGTNSFNTGVSGGPGGGGSINLVAGSLQYGGGGGAGTSVGGATSNGTGTSGAVRIIWGTNRAFPTTNTTDVNL